MCLGKAEGEDEIVDEEGDLCTTHFLMYEPSFCMESVEEIKALVLNQPDIE
jgi:hypothetical protein